MFRLLGIQHINFIPEGKTEPMQGYSVHMSDDTENENLVGTVPFKCFFTYAKAAEVLGIHSPIDMGRFEEHIGKPCELSFNRKGRVESLSFKKADCTTPPQTPEASKPNKL